MDWRTPAVDEIAALGRELDRLAVLVNQVEAGATDDVLWEAEHGLRHVARRAEARADDLRRLIERRKKQSA